MRDKQLAAKDALITQLTQQQVRCGGGNLISLTQTLNVDQPSKPAALIWSAGALVAPTLLRRDDRRSECGCSRQDLVSSCIGAEGA